MFLQEKCKYAYIRLGYIGHLYVYLSYDIKRFAERHT